MDLADIADLKLTGAVAGDLAGRSTGIVGDLSRDGCPDVLVSAHGSDLGGEDAGAVHLVFDVFRCRRGTGAEPGRGRSGDAPGQDGSRASARPATNETAAGVLPVTGGSAPFFPFLLLAMAAVARNRARTE